MRRSNGATTPEIARTRRIALALTVLAALAAACGNLGGTDGASETGQARISLSAVPTEIGCVKVRAAGVRTVDRAST